jgi:hypothetical protein
MKSRIDSILNEIGLETPDLPPINKREALEMGMIQGREKPKICEGCGKSAYASRSKCDQAAKSRLKQGNAGTDFLRSYECDIVPGNWHLSSSHNKLNK